MLPHPTRPARPARLARRARLPGLLGLGLAFAFACGLACKSGGTQSPGDIRAVEGPTYCPRQAVPRNGSSCPRGNSDFCVYRTTGGDFACVCGAGSWSCAAK